MQRETGYTYEAALESSMHGNLVFRLGSILTLTRLVEQRLSTAVVFNCGCHWHYSRVMVTAITHHLAPWARDTQTEPRVSVETDRSWVHRYTHCCHDG